MKPSIKLDSKAMKSPSIVLGATSSALGRAGMSKESFKTKIRSFGGNTEKIIEYCKRRVNFIVED